MSQTVSNHESNSFDRDEQGRIIVEQGRIMSRTGSNHESNRAES